MPDQTVEKIQGEATTTNEERRAAIDCLTSDPSRGLILDSDVVVAALKDFNRLESQLRVVQAQLQTAEQTAREMAEAVIEYDRAGSEGQEPKFDMWKPHPFAKATALITQSKGEQP